MNNLDNNIIQNTLFSTEVLNTLTSFLDLGPRYRFVFVKNKALLGNMPSLNIGYKVAEFIHNSDNINIKQDCFSYVKQLIADCTVKYAELGKTIYLTNIGILFEPELGLDVNLFLTNLSRNTLLLLDWDGEYKHPYLYFKHRDSKNKIDLSKLNYITI